VTKLTQADLTPECLANCVSTALTQPAHFIPPTSRAIVLSWGKLELVVKVIAR
jgi:hypothetical protein